MTYILTSGVRSLRIGRSSLLNSASTSAQSQVSSKKYAFAIGIQQTCDKSSFMTSLTAPFIRVYDWSKSIFKLHESERDELAPLLEKMTNKDAMEFVKQFDPNFSSNQVQDFARDAMLDISQSVSRGNLGKVSHLFQEPREIERIRDIYTTKTPPDKRDLFKIEREDFVTSSFRFHPHAFYDRPNNIVYVIALVDGKHSRYKALHKRTFRLAYTIAKTLDTKTPLKVRDVAQANKFYSRLL